MLQSSKTLLKGMSLHELKTWCQSKGESSFRGMQLFEWMYKKGVSNPEKMVNISNNFKNYLQVYTELSTLSLESKIKSKLENTTKYLFKLSDNKYIETVSMILENRHTVCLSSQVGCAVDCDFCSTGKMGFTRNLTSGEIIDQLIYVKKDTKTPVTNIVFMGMGEPFLNYKQVIKAAYIFHDPNGFNLGKRRITISTAGILPKIKQFIDENHKFKLAISINASNNKDRNQIMPINKKWNLETIIKEGKRLSIFKKRVIMFEYVLMKDINDSKQNAIELSTLLSGINCKINIIPFNESNGFYKRPCEESIENFLKILYKYQNRYRVLVRWSKGQDIDAGCGQLAHKESILN